MLYRLFPWRQTLTIVKPDTFVRWHRQGFRLFWKRKSRPRGRPRIPAEIQKVIPEMGHDNPAWGEERIAAELLLKVGIRISPRTVRHMAVDQPVCIRANPLIRRRGERGNSGPPQKSKLLWHRALDFSSFATRRPRVRIPSRGAWGN